MCNSVIKLKVSGYEHTKRTLKIYGGKALWIICWVPSEWAELSQKAFAGDIAKSDTAFSIILF